ncbi:MAG: hypothetical protein IJS90_04200 [Clostridia bacterium]|nr:hypothetical protein [Clostridia bacterium]
MKKISLRAFSSLIAAFAAVALFFTTGAYASDVIYSEDDVYHLEWFDYDELPPCSSEEGHDFGEWRVTEQATCVSQGERISSCVKCGLTVGEYTDEDPSNHEGPENVWNDYPAGCDYTGYTGDVYCSACWNLIRRGETIPAKGHSFGAWTVVYQATYWDTGEKKRTCSVCGYSEYETIPVLIPDKDELIKSYALPAKLGSTIRVDNNLNEIYFVPQNFELDEFYDVLYANIRELEFSVSAPNLIFDTYMVSGAKVKVYRWEFPDIYREYTVKIKGDTAGTGKTTASDARQALRLAVGLDKASYNKYLRTLDVNGDGKITADDARTLLRVSVRLELLGQDIGSGAIRFYSQKNIPLKYSTLADEINNAKLNPKSVVEVKHIRKTDDMWWNVTITNKDKYTIEDMLGKLPATATNMEKIYSIYKYIQNEFEYARGYDLYAQISSLTPLDAVVHKHLAQCLQYNGAMAEVLAYMGYDVKIVEGMRGQGNYESDTVSSMWNHYWTELYLNGKTYLIEVGQPKDNWSGAFMVLYKDSDGRYLYYNTKKDGYSFLK